MWNSTSTNHCSPCNTPRNSFGDNVGDWLWERAICKQKSPPLLGKVLFSCSLQPNQQCFHTLIYQYLILIMVRLVDILMSDSFVMWTESGDVAPSSLPLSLKGLEGLATLPPQVLASSPACCWAPCSG